MCDILFLRKFNMSPFLSFLFQLLNQAQYSVYNAKNVFLPFIIFPASHNTHNTLWGFLLIPCSFFFITQFPHTTVHCVYISYQLFLQTKKTTKRWGLDGLYHCLPQGGRKMCFCFFGNSYCQEKYLNLNHSLTIARVLSPTTTRDWVSHAVYSCRTIM